MGLDFSLDMEKLLLGLCTTQFQTIHLSYIKGDKNNGQQQVCAVLRYGCKSSRSPIYWYRDFTKNKNDLQLAEHEVHDHGTWAAAQARGTLWKECHGFSISHRCSSEKKMEEAQMNQHELKPGENLCI